LRAMRRFLTVEGSTVRGVPGRTPDRQEVM
jgi:hypothetical protein